MSEIVLPLTGAGILNKLKSVDRSAVGAVALNAPAVDRAPGVALMLAPTLAEAQRVLAMPAHIIPVQRRAALSTFLNAH